MKVLKHGTGQKGWSTKITCTGAGNGGRGCGAKLLVEQPDLFRTSRHSYDGSSEHFVTCKCVDCGILNDIENVPGSIRLGLPTYLSWEAPKLQTLGAPEVET